jgi:hypothetical protein
MAAGMVGPLLGTRNANQIANVHGPRTFPVRFA